MAAVNHPSSRAVAATRPFRPSLGTVFGTGQTRLAPPTRAATQARPGAANFDGARGRRSAGIDTSRGMRRHIRMSLLSDRVRSRFFRLRAGLRDRLARAAFDEGYYRLAHPDVDNAIRAGTM